MKSRGLVPAYTRESNRLEGAGMMAGSVQTVRIMSTGSSSIPRETRGAYHHQTSRLLKFLTDIILTCL